MGMGDLGEGLGGVYIMAGTGDRACDHAALGYYLYWLVFGGIYPFRCDHRSRCMENGLASIGVCLHARFGVR